MFYAPYDPIEVNRLKEQWYVEAWKERANQSWPPAVGEDIAPTEIAGYYLVTYGRELAAQQLEQDLCLEPRIVVPGESRALGLLQSLADEPSEVESAVS